MHRRSLLSTTGVMCGALVGGCSGRLQSVISGDVTDGPDRWSQHGYDPAKTNWIPDGAGPTDGVSIRWTNADVNSGATVLGRDDLVYSRSTTDPVTEGGNPIPVSTTPSGAERWAMPEIQGTVFAIYGDEILVRTREDDWTIGNEILGLDLDDGSVNWSIPVSSTSVVTPPGRSYWSPTLRADQAFAPTNAGITCLDVANQRIEWEASLTEDKRTRDMENAAWITPAVTDEHVITYNQVGGQERCSVCTIDRKTGALDAVIALDESEEMEFALMQRYPVVGDNHMYASVMDGDGNSRYYCLDPFTHETKWWTDLGKRWYTTNSPAYGDDRLIIVYGSPDGADAVAALNPADGSLLWTVEQATFSWSGVPAILGDHVYVVYGEYILAIEANIGEVSWDFSITEWAIQEGLSERALADFWNQPSGPVFLDDTMYAWGNAGSGMIAFEST